MKVNDLTNFFDKISVVIAAAGKGTRSGLDYPKCLYRINQSSILERILKRLIHIDNSPTIIVSPSGHNKILDEVRRIKVNTKFVQQQHPNGMGDAVLQLQSIKSKLNENILLIWGDVPFISLETIERCIFEHFKKNHSFTLPTIVSDNPYTIIKRDHGNKICGITETKNQSDKNIPSRGERDLGMFIFKRDLVLDLLQEELPNKFNKNDSEHGFLYLVEHLYNGSYQIGSIEAKEQKESISFNSIEDINNI